MKSSIAMASIEASALLSNAGLRSTKPRRLVLEVFAAGAAFSPAALYAILGKRKVSMSLVTVYRVLEQFLQKGIVHRHPCDGSYSLCTMPGVEGHHGFLHCGSCQSVEEFVNPELCRSEDRIAREKGFSPAQHVSEILGTCARCVIS
jgi:Fur family ferric uptake transcriptional regulator